MKKIKHCGGISMKEAKKLYNVLPPWNPVKCCECSSEYFLFVDVPSNSQIICEKCS
jgi:hypothetical protein